MRQMERQTEVKVKVKVKKFSSLVALLSTSTFTSACF